MVQNVQIWHIYTPCIYKPTDSRNSMKLKEDKYKEIHLKTFHNQILRNKAKKKKRKILTAFREKWHITHKGTPVQIRANFPSKTVTARSKGYIVQALGRGKKEMVIFKLYIQQKDSSRR